ncbi:MAG: hypothetical protein AAF311_02820 [Pseudomonadota bacterium]
MLDRKTPLGRDRAAFSLRLASRGHPVTLREMAEAWLAHCGTDPSHPSYQKDLRRNLARLREWSYGAIGRGKLHRRMTGMGPSGLADGFHVAPGPVSPFNPETYSAWRPTGPPR